MGQRGSELIGVDKKELIQMLNEALSEEWLAYYQYWIGARVMEGPMRTEVEEELLIHADEELNHATMLVERIDQLDGTPVLSPDQWYEFAGCDYEVPEDPYIEVILEQNLNGERCAIERYQDIASFTQGKDHSTYQMAVQIMNDELEHEQEIEDWLVDIERMKENLQKLCTD